MALTGNFWLALRRGGRRHRGARRRRSRSTTLRPLLGRDPLTTILATFGISLVLQKYALWQWGPSARKIQEPITGQFTLFYLEYPWYRIAIALLAAAIIGALCALPEVRQVRHLDPRHHAGPRHGAGDGHPGAARPHRGLRASARRMAAASGVLFGPLGGVTQTMGLDFTLRAFIVVVVGGMGNLGGSILASIFISLLEAYASTGVSPAQAVIVSFVALILTLLFRPDRPVRADAEMTRP